MSEIRVRKRRRLRQKEVRALGEELSSRMGNQVFGPEENVDRAESTDYDLIFVENEARALVHDGAPFLTVKGLLAYGASRYFVTVDMGAVPYVYNGADVMTPGIVEADPDIEEGDLVWVRDQKNQQPLAVGQALLSGEELVRSQSGKGIRTIHHVGDRLWRYDQE